MVYQVKFGKILSVNKKSRNTSRNNTIMLWHSKKSYISAKLEKSAQLTQLCNLNKDYIIVIYKIHIKRPGIEII